MSIEAQYLSACANIILDGHRVDNDRTGVGTFMQTNIVLEQPDVTAHFPIFVTKKVAWRVLMGELLWFLEGSTSDRRLAEITFGDGERDTIWTANWKAKPFRHPTQSKESAEDFNGLRLLGPVYGKQWRCWGKPNRSHREDVSKEIDQIAEVIESIKKDPYGRRHLVSAWNPSEIPTMSLPPCHYSFQFNVIGDKLDILVNMRSGDMFLGVPFNIASYATLLHIIAKETGYKAGKLTLVIGNAHIYQNHVEQMKEQIRRQDVDNIFPQVIGSALTLPTLSINKDSSLFPIDCDYGIGYSLSDFTLNDYNPMPTISAPMAV